MKIKGDWYKGWGINKGDEVSISLLAENKRCTWMAVKPIKGGDGVAIQAKDIARICE